MFDNTVKNSTNNGGGQNKEEKKEDAFVSAPTAPVSKNNPTSMSSPHQSKEEDGPAEEPAKAIENKPANISDNKSNDIKEVDDIFADTENTSPVVAPEFSVNNKKPDQFQPKTVSSSGGSNLPPDRAGLKKIIMLMSIAVFLGVFGYGGYFVYNKFFKSDNVDLELESGDVKEEYTKDIEVEEPKEAVDEDQIIEEPIETGSLNPKLDSDKDGLSDDEEEALGMNINSVDSDDDGLFDREEVRVYKTNPINPDTDGDGFLDGAEVEKGYNPNGPGKLYDIN